MTEKPQEPIREIENLTGKDLEKFRDEILQKFRDELEANAPELREALRRANLSAAITPNPPKEVLSELITELQNFRKEVTNLRWEVKSLAQEVKRAEMGRQRRMGG